MICSWIKTDLPTFVFFFFGGAIGDSMSTVFELILLFCSARIKRDLSRAERSSMEETRGIFELKCSLRAIKAKKRPIKNIEAREKTIIMVEDSPSSKFTVWICMRFWFLGVEQLLRMNKYLLKNAGLMIFKIPETHADVSFVLGFGFVWKFWFLLFLLSQFGFN